MCVCSCMHKNLSTCCTGGGCYQLQLVLVVLLHSATCTKTARALGQPALCGSMLIYSIYTCLNSLCISALVPPPVQLLLRGDKQVCMACMNRVFLTTREVAVPQLSGLASAVLWDGDTLILYLKYSWWDVEHILAVPYIMSVHPICYLLWDIRMYDICGMSNTVPCMLLCTVYTMYVFRCVYTCTCAHLVSFGYGYVMMQLCIMLYVLVNGCVMY